MYKSDDYDQSFNVHKYAFLDCAKQHESEQLTPFQIVAWSDASLQPSTSKTKIPLCFANA